jgi:hypothetical protein
MAAGCSITFGVGLNEQEIWPHRFKERYVSYCGYQLDDVNLLNLGETGASNDSIVRTVLPQSHTVKPDLLLVQFTYMNRIEYLSGPLALGIGQWFLGADDSDPKWLAELRGLVESYYGFYTDEFGFTATMRNILLLQSYCEANSIPYLFWWVMDRRKEAERLANNPVCAQLHSMLNLQHFCDIDPQVLEIDKAADDKHAGPVSHRAIAERLFEFQKEHLDTMERDRSSPSNGYGYLLKERMKDKLKRLRQEDPHIYPVFSWIFDWCIPWLYWGKPLPERW